MRLDVEPRHLDEVRAILEAHLPGRRVLAFGSRVTGKARPHSDLDLALLGDGPLPTLVLATLREMFDESGLPFRVDLVDWATTSPEFRAVILAASVDLCAGG